MEGQTKGTKILCPLSAFCAGLLNSWRHSRRKDVFFEPAQLRILRHGGGLGQRLHRNGKRKRHVDRDKVNQIFKTENPRANAPGILFFSDKRYQSQSSFASFPSSSLFFSVNAESTVTVVSVHERFLHPSSMPRMTFAASGAHEPFSISPTVRFL